jgi:hypothetical protein
MQCLNLLSNKVCLIKKTTPSGIVHTAYTWFRKTLITNSSTKYEIYIIHDISLDSYLKEVSNVIILISFVGEGLNRDLSFY